MKIEFVKKEKFDGDVYWYTTIDGKFVENSLSSNEQSAYDLYNKVKDNGGLTIIKILESFDTETQSTN
jgi:hypothetical protein